MRLEPDTGPIRELEKAVFDPGVVGKPGKNAENIGIGFAAPEAETADDGERHLVAAVGEDGMALPLVAFEHFKRARELHDAIRLRHVDLDDVAVGTHTAEAHEILDVLR